MSGCSMRTAATPAVSSIPTAASPGTSSAVVTASDGAGGLTNAQASTSYSSATAPDVGTTVPNPAAATTSGSGGAWSMGWDRAFTDLKLAPADIAYLKAGNFTDAQLSHIADELAHEPLIDSAGNTVRGPVATPATPTDPGTGSSAPPTVDPSTGQVVPTPTVDPNTGQPAPTIDPDTGQPEPAPQPQPQIGVDPNTGQPLPSSSTPTVDPNTGQPVATTPVVDPNTGQPVPSPAVDPTTGLPASTTTPTSTADPAAGGPGWSPQWQQTFTDLKLDPADIQFLSTSGFTTAQLQEVADGLKKSPELDPNAPANTNTGVTGSGTPGTSTDPTAPTDGTTGQPGAAGWSPAWEQKFTALLTKLGLSGTDLSGQLAQIKGGGLTDEQLQKVYDGMNTSVGAWSPQWEAKFRGLMKQLNVPADQTEQIIQGLAQRGLTDDQLQKFYDDEVARAPGWNADWEKKFKDLGLPDSMMADAKSSGASNAELKDSYDKLLKIKLDALHNGRLKKLDQASATDDQKWQVLTANQNDKDFEKTVDGIHDGHVSWVKKGLSMALNFVPGVGAIEFAFGKDFITGSKIDRTNPLNIGMAILSALPAISYVKGVAQGIKGATMLGGALRAGADGAEAAVVGGGAVNTAAAIAGDSSKMATMLSAIKGGATTAEAVGISGKTAESLMRFGAEGLTTGQKVARAMDYAKMALPGVNRIGRGAELMSLGKGYAQLTGYAATFGKQVGQLESLGDEGDRLMKNMPTLSRTNEADLVSKMAALSKDGKEGTQAFKIAERQLADVRKITEVTGLKPSEIRAITERVTPALQGRGTAFAASGKYWHLNPTASQATASLEGAADGSGLLARSTGAITGTAGHVGMDTVKLGRGITVGKDGIMSTADFANVSSALTGTRIGELGTQLGVGAGEKFRALAQVRRVFLPGSEQKVISDVSAMNHEGSNAFNAMRYFGGKAGKMIVAPSVGMLGFSVASGQAHQVTEPLWDLYKNRDANNAAEAKAKAEGEAKYQQEQKDLDAAQARMEADGSAGGAGDGSGGGTSGTGSGAPSAPGGASGGVAPVATGDPAATGTGDGSGGQAPAAPNQLSDV